MTRWTAFPTLESVTSQGSDTWSLLRGGTPLGHELRRVVGA